VVQPQRGRLHARSSLRCRWWHLSANSSSGDARPASAFAKGLGETGYEDGKNVRIEYRWADGQYDRLPSMADLVRDNVAVIAALGTPAVRAAKAATTTIPIAFTTIADPVQIGFVASLSRPGGNATGATLLAVQIGPKLLEILRGVVPSATTIALLVNPTNPNSEMQLKNTQEAADKLGLQLHILRASVEPDFDKAFADLSGLKREAAVRLLEVDPAFTISAWIARGGMSNAKLMMEGLRKAGLPE
jgi:putative tryptophan/tyrosine transport system substrate-binding protein